MSRTVYLALALLALVCSVAAHAGHNRGGMPYGWRNKRAVSASTCSNFQCAVQGGSCDLSAGRYCSAGQHCGAENKCYDNVALGSSCNTNAIENECAQGSCVSSGSAATCQYFRELMPGNPCSSDTECFFSESADGSGSNTGSCVAGFCFGKKVNEACTASHQCVVGSFCDADNICKTLSTEGQVCRADAEVTGCSAQFTCLDNVCSKRYTRSENQGCSTTQNCQSGLFCSSSKVCTKAATTSSGTACDIGANSCAATEECSCKNYNTANQVATCNAIKGTYADMSSVEQSALSCLSKHGCNSDTANTTNVACIKQYCSKEYCTFFTRNVNQVYSTYPSCVVGRMVETNDYYSLLIDTCTPYKPSNEQPTSSSASSISASIFVAFTILFFAL